MIKNWKKKNLKFHMNKGIFNLFHSLSVIVHATLSPGELVWSFLASFTALKKCQVQHLTFTLLLDIIALLFDCVFLSVILVL